MTKLGRTDSRLKRLRWAVRGVLMLGVAASVTANILHANQNMISQTISAWPPLAFLLTVEVLSRVPVHRKWLASVRLCATSVVAGIAAWVSYWHMAAVAGRYGEGSDSAHLLPFSVDGLIVIASVSLVEIAGRVRATEEALPTGTFEESLVRHGLAQDGMPNGNARVPIVASVNAKSEVRVKGMALLAEGVPVAKVADQIGVPVKTVYNWRAKLNPGSGDR